MWINCQRRVAAATVPLSGAASHTICVSFMTPVSAMVLVAIPLLSPLVIGHSTLAIGMLIMLPLLFDHHYSPLPCFGSEVEAPPPSVYCVDYLLSRLCGYILTQSIVRQRLLFICSYCLILLIVLHPSEDQTTIAIVSGYYTA
jgi:hypothetical protein